jgi:hypothetical protein
VLTLQRMIQPKGKRRNPSTSKRSSTFCVMMPLL